MNQIPLPSSNPETQPTPDIYSFGFGKSLNKGIPTQSNGVVYDILQEAVNTGSVFSGGNLTLKSLSIGGLVRQVAPGDDIQAAVDAVSREGGGTVQLLAKEYLLTSPINLKPLVNFVGVRPDVTILNFGGGSGNLTLLGTQAYTTGTITNITSGVVVTGSGTAWLANVKAGMHLFLGTRWYEIASVLSDTSLILAEGYGDNVSFASTYRIAYPITDSFISNFSIVNSSSNGLQVQDVRKLTINNLVVKDCAIGASFTNCSEVNAELFLSVLNSSHGYSLTNFGLFDWESCNAFSNSGSGFSLDNAKTGSLFACASSSNTVDGFNCTTVDEVAFLMSAESNGGQGIEFVGSSANNSINGNLKNNTSDGLKLTASTDTCRIYDCNIRANGGYGVNIAASSCDDNMLFGNRFSGNSSGSINDSGSGTQIS